MFHRRMNTFSVPSKFFQANINTKKLSCLHASFSAYYW